MFFSFVFLPFPAGTLQDHALMFTPSVGFRRELGDHALLAQQCALVD